MEGMRKPLATTTRGFKSQRETSYQLFSQDPSNSKGTAVQFADSQDSRTLPPTATSGEKHGSTWALSYQNPDDDPVADGYSTTALQHYTTTEPPSETVALAYRQAVLEGEVLPRIQTEAGLDAMVRRWHGIPDSLPPEEQASRLTERLVAADEATAEVTAWAERRVPRRPGRSMPLPAPAPPRDRWQGAHLWVEGALADPAVINHPRVQRIGRQHLPWLLRALASYADHDSGHHVTAANATVGCRAAALVSEHIARGGTWTGRRTDLLSDTTLAGQVSALAAALIAAGWMRERARGRHLTRLERAVAWIRTRLHQTRAASVRDLTVPPHARSNHHSPTRAAAPAWAHTSNPHYRRLVVGDLQKTLRELLHLPALHTHPSVGRLPCLVTVFRGLLTREHARETPRSQKTPPGRDTRPTLSAQKTAARLIQRLPWLLRGSVPGRRRHIGALARLLDETGCAHVTADGVTAAIDATLAARGWELHPETITSPLAWLPTILKNLTAGPLSA